MSRFILSTEKNVILTIMRYLSSLVLVLTDSVGQKAVNPSALKSVYDYTNVKTGYDTSISSRRVLGKRT